MPENSNKETVSIATKQNIKSQQYNRVIFIIIFCAAVFTIFSAHTLFKFSQKPPKNFPIGAQIVIENGTGMKKAIGIVKEAGLIRSELALYLEMLTHHQNNSIKASTYVFNEALSIKEMADVLTQGNSLSNLVKITYIEGQTSKQIAEHAAELLQNFDSKTFLKLAIPLEGRLFPETYLIPKDYSESELLKLLTTTFAEKIKPLEEKILKHSLTLDEIIILASILEREANSIESKRIVSGILQKRLLINMPLQVDASLEYILDKPLAELTAEDLDIESPYNTYLNYGLPPTPIGNPGLDTIESVLDPEESDFLFYITGDDGNFYYAKNFDEHRLNISKYLR